MSAPIRRALLVLVGLLALCAPAAATAQQSWPQFGGSPRHHNVAAQENAFLQSHSWDDYAEWHLGLTEGAAEDTKARYAFVYGDLRRLHRSGLIACIYRAAEWRHKAIELAAHELLQELDRKTGLTA